MIQDTDKRRRFVSSLYGPKLTSRITKEKTHTHIHREKELLGASILLASPTELKQTTSFWSWSAQSALQWYEDTARRTTISVAVIRRRPIELLLRRVEWLRASFQLIYGITTHCKLNRPAAAYRDGQPSKKASERIRHSKLYASRPRLIEQYNAPASSSSSSSSSSSLLAAAAARIVVVLTYCPPV